MEKNICSQLSLNVGFDEETDNCPHFKVEVHVNAQKANEYLDLLKDAKVVQKEWAFVITVPVKEGSEEKVKAVLDKRITKVYSYEIKNGRLAYESEICKERHLVLFSIGLPKEKVERFKSKFDDILPGLQELTKESHNHAKLEVVLGNNFNELAELIFEKGFTHTLALF